MEKKKLLLVAISVGVFLVLTIGAAILVFTPKNTSLPFETITNNDNPETIDVIPPPPFESIAAVSEQEITQPASLDAVDLVRNPGGVPGLVPPTEGIYSPYEAERYTERSTESVISVTQPTTAAVPSTPPTGRAANQSTSSVSTPTAAARPAQTTTTPAQTTTSLSQTASTPAQTASTVTKTTTAPAQTASSATKTTTTPAQTASSATKTTTPAQTASTPAQATTTPAQTASTPAQTTIIPASVASTGTQSIPLSQTGIYNDFWVQTGAFSTIASAEGVIETLASRGITAIVENGIINGRTLFRVRVGPYTSRNEANYWLALIQSMDGFEDSQVRTSDNLH
jgi:hypothetical protein